MYMYIYIVGCTLQFLIYSMWDISTKPVQEWTCQYSGIDKEEAYSTVSISAETTEYWYMGGEGKSLLQL